jgi:hypothetical protein
MARVSIASAQSAALHAPARRSGDGIETRALFARDRDRIQLFLHRFKPGARLEFKGASGDWLLYVWSGGVHAGGAHLESRSSAIVEYGASLIAVASTAGAELLAFRMQQRERADRVGGHIHLLPNERVPRIETSEGKRVSMSLHADSSCPTCRLWLHENDYTDAEVETAVHSHSEDEVIFVRAGSIRLGSRLYGPGTALAIAANTKYGFFSGPDGLSLVNFRGASPTYKSADGSVVLDEAALWRKHVPSPVYL